MKIRLIKQEQQCRIEKEGNQVSETQLMNSVQSWIKEFKLCKENRGKESIQQLRRQRE